MISPKDAEASEKSIILKKTKEAFEDLLEYLGLIDWYGVNYAIKASWDWLDEVANKSEGPSIGTAIGVAVYRILYRLSLAAVPHADRETLGDALGDYAIQFIDEGGTPDQIKGLTSLSEDIEIDPSRRI